MDKGWMRVGSGLDEGWMRVAVRIRENGIILETVLMVHRVQRGLISSQHQAHSKVVATV